MGLPSGFKLKKMKKTIFIFLVIISVKSYAQTSTALSYNYTHSGRNLSLIQLFKIKEKHEFGIGVRFNINVRKHEDDLEKVFYKRLYATEPLQRFGIHGVYHYNVLSNITDVEMYLFYDVQATYANTQNDMYEHIGNNIFGEKLHFLTVYNFGPFLWIEQNVGLGFRAKLNNNWTFYQKIGLGTAFIIGKDELVNRFENYNGFKAEFSPLINVGFAYKFNK